MEPNSQLKFFNSEQAHIENSELNDSKINKNEDHQPLNIEELRNKKSVLLNSTNNPSTEIDFRRASLFYNENSISSQEFNESYQEYSKIYHQKTSLYNFKTGENSTHLIIFDSENEKEELKVLETPLDWGTSIAQLPNGELFCYGKFFPPSGITLIIDNDYRIHMLPDGTPCCLTSAIYFERCVYCFGGDGESPTLTISSKFDFDENQWIKLASMPKLDSILDLLNGGPPQPESSCHSVLFDRKILISGYRNEHLLLYSIDIDSYSTIPQKFGADKVKILVNIEKRLYLIETGYNGSIYESEITNCDNWTKVINSYSKNESMEKMIMFGDNGNPMAQLWLPQVYCAYNKGKIYIGCNNPQENIEYFTFNLNEKEVVKLK